MKKINFKNAFKSALLVLGILLAFASCKKDDDKTDVILLDGFYIQGSVTALTSLNADGLMAVTYNEITKTLRPSLYEIYIPIKAGADGFNIVQVSGSIHKTWGPGDTKTTAPGSYSDHVKTDYTRGNLVETSNKFTVSADGMYHVVIDTELGTYLIIPVTHWAVIGAATPGGWSTESELTAGTFDLNSMAFTVTNIKMSKGDFKLRYSGGWKAIIDTTLDVGDGKKGVLVNCNFGGAVDALVPGGDNITFAEIGYYTIAMNWTLADGFSAVLTKTGSVEPIDYTSYELGLIGDGISVADTSWGWGATYNKKVPVVAGTNYTWLWNDVKVVAEKSFKIRQGDNWDGKSIGYKDVTMAGADAANFETNGDGNFVVKTTGAGTYDFELVIDASSENYTFTSTKK